ncbi:hypothetical protein [Salimicrobium halophilum]|uniref:Uncharacterized protein n=1 Tax=Salimicrobium halophilum TaxID=86666 RepID=A0A1G8RJQ8_9BACI|nr:hypothetical protein [Salimicrobium halophilum]SDJ17314.1 hypothetical protein SAMN04490247_1083 [Salimicrobium halophilum]
MVIRFVTAFMIAAILFGLIATFVPQVLNFMWLAISILLVLSLGYLAIAYIQKTKQLLKQK